MAPAAGAVTLRYALVVGNNESSASDLPALKHAEHEAGRLAASLARFAGFPRERTVVLRGPTHAAFVEAAKQIAAWKDADLEQVPGARTLFAFFFTGHGLRGELLLRDQPVSARALGDLFREVGADFGLGVFDACYAGSLAGAGLAGKGGIVATPGVNLFEVLPRDVLQARGRMWFSSSGPDGLSFEDSRLGGVFTHFFIQALRKAPRDGPGIPLDRIWTYARQQTRRYTSHKGKPQKPQMVAAVSGEAFPYFSFPIKRDAELRFAPGVAGQFVLSYADGALSEVIEKRSGSELAVAVYPGEAELTQYDGGRRVLQERLDLRRGRVTLRTPRDAPTAETLGRQVRTLWQKGQGLEGRALEATLEAPHLSIGLGATYGYTPADAAELSAEHRALAVLRFDRDIFAGALRVGYARGSGTFTTWRYEADALVTGAEFGAGWDLGPTRLVLGARADVLTVFQSFGDGSQRTTWGVEAGPGLSLVVPANAPVSALVELAGGVRYAPGAAQGQEHAASAWVVGSVGLLFGVR